jgi:hypothetical protein
MVQRISVIANTRCSQIFGCLKLSPYEIFNDAFNFTDPIAFFLGQIITVTINNKELQTPLSNYFWNLGDGAWALALVSA